MRLYYGQLIKRRPRVSTAAFTLMELLVAFVIMTMVASGIIYGYAQSNRFAEWSSMSLAAQSYALQGLEQVRAAKWDLSASPVADDIPAPTNYTQVDIMDIPVSGAPIYITNYIKLIQLPGPVQMREVWSQCIWVFPLNKQTYTNTVITWRAPDKA